MRAVRLDWGRVPVRPRLAVEVAGLAVVHPAPRGRQVPVVPPDLLVHRLVRLVLAAAVADREGVPAGAAAPAADPADVEEW
ncbi:hypothetical protein SAMN05216266_10863 [Amycolatopsis marina]|uniref:Uncharacterized protein n=1 Tax=Amycolatopsis marina TaxID=490629 RepID=A0A1I1A0C9_9PSEU|nr:hypothetical protein SAMN05216266_10863 [Amycolatopsis marina]